MKLSHVAMVLGASVFAITASSILNFKVMIQRITQKNVLIYFNGYGCYCGKGGRGKPKDPTDMCCYNHECCYENLQHHGCHPYIDHYRFLIINNSVLCKHKDSSVCATSACECDKHASLCFKREAPTYNHKLRHYPAVMCKEGSRPRAITMDSASHPSVGEIILLATSSAVTTILYAVYRHKSKIADSLKGAKKVTLDQDLKNLLMEAPGKCVPYAVIEGVVRSVKESLNSQFVDSCKGVVQRLTLQEHKMVWNRTTHFWNNYEKIIHQRTNTVPFDLVAPGSEGPHDVAVRVLKPLSAAELSLETVYERFHPSVQSLTDAIGHYISGERPKGIKETEEMLSVGVALTGVGELVLDSNTIKLQPPKQGLRYCLSSLGFETLLKRQESSARFWKVLATLCGLASCALLIFVLHKQYRCQRERRRLRQMLQGMAAGGDGANPCVVCLGNSRACVFLDCGHVCSCLKCYEALPRPPHCPICRQLIARVVPLYNS